jgi:hypothetical protein
MSINVFQLLDTVMNDDVVRSLAGRFGLTPDLARKVTGAAAPSSPPSCIAAAPPKARAGCFPPSCRRTSTR